jgi:4'-phosphopantetheinyl transferase
MNHHHVQCWWTLLGDVSDRLGELETELPDDELQRASRFKVVEARHRFVLGRTLLRLQLGQLLHVEPARLKLSVGDRGKPRLAAPVASPPTCFNLSHSGDIVVLAVAAVDIGIDVERLRKIANAEGLARRYFSPAEQELVCGLTGAGRDHAFLRIWTRKEAYLKATGIGVGMPLREVETEPDPDAPPRLIAVQGDRGEAARWALVEAEIPGAVCTAATLEERPRIDVRRLRAADFEIAP